MAIGYLDSQYLTDIADSIRSKNGTQNTYTPSQMPQAILDIPTGGGSDPIAVRFLDFDGEIVDELTDTELNALTELPSAPDHSQDEIPLVFDEWNWLLSEIKTFRAANPTWTVNVGANYHTQDGKLHFIYDVDVNGISLILRPNYNMEIDWGDGTTETLPTNTNTTHTFTNKGRYHIKVSCSNSGNTLDARSGVDYISQIRECSSISFTFYSSTYSYTLESISVSSSQTILPSLSYSMVKWYTLPRTLDDNMNQFLSSSNMSCLKYQPLVYNISGNFTFMMWLLPQIEDIYVPSVNGTLTLSYTYYNPSLKRIHFPDSVTSISNLSYCTALEEITIPSGVTSLAASSLYGCYKLKKVELPSTIETINNSVFYECYSLEEINLEDTVITSLGSSVFRSCRSLKQLIVPSTVTSIGNSCFATCMNLSLIMKPTTPPTLGNTSAISDVWRILVPYSADHSVLNAYKAANIWSTYASKIYESDPPASN